MGVPSWLMKLVIVFLSERERIVRYKGQSSSKRSLPGGGPQGTLLGLLLFLVLINDAGFDNQVNNVGNIATCHKKIKLINKIHLKYVDDLTLGEAINMRELQSVPDELKVLPAAYHERTGHFLPHGNSKLYKQLESIHDYSAQNCMKINLKKTKLMLFNPCKKYDFSPYTELQDHAIESVEEFNAI